MSWLGGLAIIGGLVALGVFTGVMTMYKFVGEDPHVNDGGGRPAGAH